MSLNPAHCPFNSIVAQRGAGSKGWRETSEEHVQEEGCEGKEEDVEEPNVGKEIKKGSSRYYECGSVPLTGLCSSLSRVSTFHCFYLK